MCKLLVNRGANFQIIDNNKETPLIYARKKKNKNIVDYFSGLKNSLRQHEAIKKINYVTTLDRTILIATHDAVFISYGVSFFLFCFDVTHLTADCAS